MVETGLAKDPSHKELAGLQREVCLSFPHIGRVATMFDEVSVRLHHKRGFRRHFLGGRVPYLSAEISTGCAGSKVCTPFP